MFPVLTLFSVPWRDPVKIVAAIGPFHDRDEDRKRDIRVLAVCKEVTRHVGGAVSLLHCSNVPAYLAEYKKEVRDYRKQSVAQFAEDNGYATLKTSIIHGQPSKEITKYLEEHGVDILGMGSVPRGPLEAIHHG